MSLGPYGAAAVKVEYLEEQAEVLCDRLQKAAYSLEKRHESLGDPATSEWVHRLSAMAIYIAMMQARIARNIENKRCACSC